MINDIKIEGEICGKERPELRTFPSGDLYLRFSIMWQGIINSRNSKSFFTVVLYGQIAEQFNVKNLWQRGRTIRVEGSLNSWASKEGKRYTDIICRKLEMLGSKPEPTQLAPVQTPKPAPKPTVAPPPIQQPKKEEPKVETIDTGFDVADDEEYIPF